MTKRRVRATGVPRERIDRDTYLSIVMAVARQEIEDKRRRAAEDRAARGGGGADE